MSHGVVGADTPARVASRMRAGPTPRRSFVDACVALAVCGRPALLRAIEPECMNAKMEERMFLGMDPFAPPCQDQDIGPLPVYPIFSALATVQTLLASEKEFCAALRLGAPLRELQLPPVINPVLLERVAAGCADPAAVREAARSYVRAAYDANELVEFAQRSRREMRPDEETAAYADRSLEAARRSAEALRRLVALLPKSVLERQGALTARTRD